jgi:hypothetical protein
MLSNNMNFANLMSVTPEGSDPEYKGLFAEASLRMYSLLKSKDFNQWFDRNAKRQPQLYVILFMRADAIFSQLGAMAQNSRVIEFSKTNQPHQLKGEPWINNVIRIIILFTRELQEKMVMGAVYVEVPRVTPDAANPDLQASKIQKILDGSATPTARGSGNESQEDRDDSVKKNRRRSGGANPNGGLVPVNTPKKDAKELGFFVPLPGCNPQKMFGGIDSSAAGGKGIPCYHHHAKTLACTKPNCNFLHGSFIKFDEPVRTTILSGMLEHKTAVLNPSLKNNKRFKAVIDEKYAELWNNSADSSTNDGA